MRVHVNWSLCQCIRTILSDILSQSRPASSMPIFSSAGKSKFVFFIVEIHNAQTYVILLKFANLQIYINTRVDNF